MFVLDSRVLTPIPLYFVFFVFFKPKTAYEMRISDWSSDVCSSDLPTGPSNPHRRLTAHPPPAGSFLGGFRTPASSALTHHDRPASETLHTSRPPGGRRTESGERC